MATRTQQDAAHEIWVETDATTFTGTSPAVVITTGIRASTAELNNTRIRLYLHNIVGNPSVAPPTAVTVAAGPFTVIQVTFQNTSGNPADQASWKLEVERMWSASR